jgi:hypothetical protein
MKRHRIQVHEDGIVVEQIQATSQKLKVKWKPGLVIDFTGGLLGEPARPAQPEPGPPYDGSLRRRWYWKKVAERAGGADEQERR